MNKDIIERLKTNERAFCFLSKEEQELVRKLNNDKTRGEVAWLRGGEFSDFSEGWLIGSETVVRISPDYTEPEQPEFEVCEVNTNGGYYKFYRELKGHCCSHCLHEALCMVDFAGVLWEGEEDFSTEWKIGVTPLKIKFKR